MAAQNEVQSTRDSLQRTELAEVKEDSDDDPNDELAKDLLIRILEKETEFAERAALFVVKIARQPTGIVSDIWGNNVLFRDALGRFIPNAQAAGELGELAGTTAFFIDLMLIPSPTMAPDPATDAWEKAMGVGGPKFALMGPKRQVTIGPAPPTTISPAPEWTINVPSPSAERNPNWNKY